MGDLAVNISIGLIKAGVFVYDLLTYPVYAVVQKPWKKQSCMERQRAKEVAVTEGICFHNTDEPHPFQVEICKANIKTVEEALSYACKKHGNKKALGTRQLVKEHDEVQPNGRVFKKYEMGEYSWLTYAEVDDTAQSFGRGLRSLGHNPKENIIIFAETRAEWLISAMGCFKQNIPVATLYATLGDDAIIHGINETEVEHIITSHELLPKFRNILEHCPKVNKITYFEDQLKPTELTGYKDDIIFNSFKSVVELGKTCDYADVPPQPEDIAIIMYTSGSTGAPKGVLMSHSTIVHSMTAYASVLDMKRDDVYLAYLPLAHVLELMGESMMMMYGVPMGYSTPLTMTDRSSKVKRGCKGDASVLQPTMMPAVPLILDRIYKAILDKVAAQGPFLKALFDFALEYKLNWIRRGWDTPICNWAIFRKIRALLGGHIRIMAVGGAPLSPDTHDFIRVALGVPVLQGYGLTETCACATLMDTGDMSTGRVGAPLSVCDIKLVDWDEGNYRITDKPRPRGEVIIGGENIAIGYYKNPEKTREDFFEMDGRRWFRTGDVGQFDKDGSLRIIDRKKDLVKLQYGEYVSLGKVEAALKISPLVENICVYGDSSKNHTVALVCPVPKGVEELAKSQGVGDLSIEELCRKSEIKQAILKELVATGKKAKLEKFELPGDCVLVSEVWTPDSGLVTAAFKLKRKTIQMKYQDEINRMYGS